MAAALIASAPAPDRFAKRRTVLRATLALAYAFVGVIHLRSPGAFLPIMPDWVPFPRTVVLATGVCELLGAAGLLIPRTRWWAGVMLALYALCVYPANIKHAVDHIAVGGMALGPWYHVPRLLFQPVIIWWALFAGRVTDWPFRPPRA